MNRLGRWVVSALFLSALYYGVFGGEYSMFELRRARAAVVSERATLDELHHQIDSLSAWADSLQDDPVTLERVAREQWGMIREGETLYRFAPPPEAPDDEEGEAAG